MNKKNYKLSIKQDGKSSKQGNLSFEGDLTIKNALAIKKGLIKEIYQFDKLAVVVKHVDNMDITFIQLLVALKKSFEIVKMDVDVPERVAGLMKSTGLADMFSLGEQVN